MPHGGQESCNTGSGKRRLLMRYALVIALFLNAHGSGWAQMDQGAVTGVITDKLGAVVPGAEVTLTNVDTAFVMKTKADASGAYNFTPVKIGRYSVSATAPGFRTTTQLNIRLNLQQRLNVPISLELGAVQESVTVSDTPPLMQTQQGSIGQVINTDQLSQVPLNGRNWVYIAHLTAGAAPTAGGSRGGGTGDFSSNGQRAEQNNFLLDGVDNNVNVIDFPNGTSYVVRPPPDALAEFRLDTNAYSAEFGHSAGAVLNASVKSGTNRAHGGLWEYFRNDALNARDFNALRVPVYRQNQFGGMLGGPAIKNKLFFFGVAEADRIVQGQAQVIAVPTMLMRQGDFSELLNPSLTGSSQPTRLYQPNSGGAMPLTCNGRENVFCANQMDPIARRILSLYPQPNTNGGRTFANYAFNQRVANYSWQWTTRADWNISEKDQLYSRFSYWNVPGTVDFPLGPVLDGAFSLASGTKKMLSQSFMLSETHLFTSQLINEFRVGYNYGNYRFLQANYQTSMAETLGLGGIPPVSGAGWEFNGGLPRGNVTGIAAFGSGSFNPTIERQNVYQILDNVTMIRGRHSLKFGVSLQSIRFATLQSPGNPRGGFTFNGLFTSRPGTPNTGYGVADFLAGQMSSADLSTEILATQARWYNAAYVQDDWRVTSKLTVNLGLRYDYFQPYKEVGDRQGNFLPTGPLTPGGGTGVFQLPEGIQSRYPLSATFLGLLARNNIKLETLSNNRLLTGERNNFAPRLGFAYSIASKTVIHGGVGLFYGALQSQGGATLSYNYPFQFPVSFLAPTCVVNTTCANNGITLANGFSAYLSNLGDKLSLPGMTGSAARFKTPVTTSYNVQVEHSLTKDLVAAAAYVGNRTRNLQSYVNYNASAALLPPGTNVTPYTPFPAFGGGNFMRYDGVSNYNSLQTKIEKRLSSGLSFLSTYTWAHSLDNARPLLWNSSAAYRNPTLIPIEQEYATSPFDVRHRVTFLGTYELPFGQGHARLNSRGALNALVGGWSASVIFAAQTGSPFTATPANVSLAAGGTARAILVGDPFAPGGTPHPTNPTITCPSEVRTVQHWFNPCAFANPLPGAGIRPVTDTAQAINYLGGRAYQLPGPGFSQVSMSLFKNFKIYEDHRLQFRADGFNVLNTPTYGTPTPAVNNNGGLITSGRSLQSFTPNARFFQLALRYIF